jgi:hypothetical protein
MKRFLSLELTLVGRVSPSAPQSTHLPTDSALGDALYQQLGSSAVNRSTRSDQFLRIAAGIRLPDASVKER